MFTSLLFSLLFEANAVPLELTQQGRLLDGSGAAVTGTHTLTFRIYTAATGGSLQWTESLSVQFNNGYYATVLGQSNTLDSDTLLGYPLYLEVQLDSNSPMTPRQTINSAPYAQIAGVAESVLGGTVDADMMSISGSPVIDATGTWVGEPVTPLWDNIQGIPAGFFDKTDDVLSSTQVEQYVQNAQNLNLSTTTKVGGNSIVTSATTLQPQWDNIQGIPAGFLDKTDNVLDRAAVEAHVEATATLNLHSNTTIGGAIILTPNSSLNWNNLQNVPTGLADGDELDILDSSCAAGEIVSWTGSNWDCVSDNTLTEAQVETYVTNAAINLATGSMINGALILTEDDNTLVGLGVSCSDEDVAKYDATTGEWYCDIDIDTHLTEAQVETYITNGALNLNAATTLAGATIVTTATDQNTQLSESEVETYITNGALSLNAATTLAGATIVTTATDANTQLSESEVETYITNGALSLNAATTLAGATIVTTATDSDTLDGLTCTTNQIAKYNGSAWVCASDNTGSGISYGSMYQVTASGTGTPIAECTNNTDILLNGGCDAPAYLEKSYPVNAVNNTAKSGWACYAGNTNVTAYATCYTP